MQKKVLNFINLKSTSRSKTPSELCMEVAQKRRKRYFTFSIGWQKKLWRCKKKESSPSHTPTSYSVYPLIPASLLTFTSSSLTSRTPSLFRSFLFTLLSFTFHTPFSTTLFTSPLISPSLFSHYLSPILSWQQFSYSFSHLLLFPPIKH